MAYVASGRSEGCIERDLQYWDIAAGIIIVKEAGGYVTDFNGENNYIANKMVIASNSLIHGDLIKIIS